MIQSYKDLIVWQKSMDLVVLVYKYTDVFPRGEIYGIVSQIRRAAVSIPSNIAEGWVRKNTKEYLNFLSIASGSAGELDTQLILSDRLQFGDENGRIRCQNLLVEVQKMLATMVKNLKFSSR